MFYNVINGHTKEIVGTFSDKETAIREAVNRTRQTRTIHYIDEVIQNKGV